MIASVNNIPKFIDPKHRAIQITNLPLSSIRTPQGRTSRRIPNLSNSWRQINSFNFQHLYLRDRPPVGFSESQRLHETFEKKKTSRASVWNRNPFPRSCTP